MTAKKTIMAKASEKKVASAKTTTARKPASRSIIKPAEKSPIRKNPIGKSARVSATTLKNVGAIAQVRHFKFTEDKPTRFDPKMVHAQVFKRGANSPDNIEFVMEPTEGDVVLFHPTPGFTNQEPPLAQLSIRVRIYNKGSETVDLDKVVLEYKTENTTVKKDVFLPSDKLVIEKDHSATWQNSREYHENGDVVFLDAPYPNKVKLSFHFKNYTGALSVTKNIQPYSHALALPFSKADFGENEFVSGYSMHGGGSQVFAYDLGVAGYDKKFTGLWDDKKKNESYRIWGKPIRAMADGTVLHFENNIPNNWKPDGSDAGMKKQKDELWGSFDFGGGGNHFYIRHGNVVALYAHMQKGSLTSSLMKNGAKVKKGDVLGKAGNSGNSTAPHLHIHLKTYKSDSEPDSGAFRPLLFNTGYTIGKEHYKTPKSNINWSKLNNQGIPGKKSKASYVSMDHPYCEYPTHWGEVAKHGISNANYQSEFDKIWTCGYYPIWVDGFDVNGETYFNVIFRPSKNVAWVARHNMDGKKYQTEFDKWVEAGYRLININSYLLKGKLRYAAVWKKDNAVKWMAYHGQSLTWHEANFEKHHKAGWVPANVSCVSIGSKTYVTALWEKKNTGGFYLRPDMTLQSFKDAFKDYTETKKFKLVYLDAYVKAGKPRLSGIWYKNAPDYNAWWEKHHLSGAQYQTEYTDMLSKGYYTRCVVGYEDGNKARYEGIWSK
ncbi:peptidoglycan DD-metalloendopeptidase family protein [Aequorivita sp. SDUM287046]|uniref:Peptidoglycan DD-metalloendopeptidase family protein n=1 Tax=Aequorivita aurantiaca TaxID=3053356 RepID=A0ABT8DJT8_9FLAO|nr:peptidoglycan DD-metalloendopeptidase family protein [Aequorivita aurantiaca]MDN3725099.1 peptidoglycan DD-metalloendopeptidase family protein [Aequorivita aurantiaca]